MRRDEILDVASELFARSGLRTSQKEVADACGILAGSLYHHFESKEAIVLELVERFRADLDRVAADAADSSNSLQPEDYEGAVGSFAAAIAACARRHRAAVLLSVYDPPRVLGLEVTDAARQATGQAEKVMGTLLADAETAGAMSDADPRWVASRVCSSMLHTAMGTSHDYTTGKLVPDLKTQILLRGLAAAPPSFDALDRSNARVVAGQIALRWQWEPDEALSDRAAPLLAAARAEFARKGLESTTVRDVARAAGVSTSRIYSFFASKDELTLAILTSFGEHVNEIWEAVMRSPATPLEKLDALLWSCVRIVDTFADDFRIQLAAMREAPPTSPHLGLVFGDLLRHCKELLSSGRKTGQLVLEGSNLDLRARCLLDVIWVPPDIVGEIGPAAAFELARHTVLRGSFAD